MGYGLQSSGCKANAWAANQLFMIQYQTKSCNQSNSAPRCKLRGMFAPFDVIFKCNEYCVQICQDRVATVAGVFCGKQAASLV